MLCRSGRALDSEYHDPGSIPICCSCGHSFPLRWSSCCGHFSSPLLVLLLRQKQGGEIGGPKRKIELGPQTREKELGRWFFSKFFTTAQENVEMGENDFFQDKNNKQFSYATEILKIKKLDLSLYKILCCNLDVYVNSVSYCDSWAHVNYIVFFYHHCGLSTVLNPWRFLFSFYDIFRGLSQKLGPN